ncbi:hypothetical protein EV175_003560 [Coemansia sp. RSA 1933]|nr:hypothetical protein EV175_003560 [Coemansia sp. RSA 1933]
MFVLRSSGVRATAAIAFPAKLGASGPIAINQIAMRGLTSDSNQATVGLTTEEKKKLRLEKASIRSQTLRKRKRVLGQLHRLTPAFKRTGTEQTGIFQAPKMLDHTGSNIALETMMAAGMHLGHSASLWNPMNLPYIFGEREGIHIINLERTVAALRRAARVVNQVAYHGGIVLFSGVRMDHRQLAIDAALHADQYYLSRKWIGGTLTNAASVLGKHGTYAQGVWDVEEASEYATVPTQNERVKRATMNERQAKRLEYAKGREEKIKAQAEDEGKVRPYRPDLIVSLSTMESQSMLTEARMSFVPTIGIVDTNCDPRCVTYAIPCNDDSVRAVSIVAGVLARAARDGLELRRHRLREAATAQSAADIDRVATMGQRSAAVGGEPEIGGGSGADSH